MRRSTKTQASTLLAAISLSALLVRCSTKERDFSDFLGEGDGGDGDGEGGAGGDNGDGDGDGGDGDGDGGDGDGDNGDGDDSMGGDTSTGGSDNTGGTGTGGTGTGGEIACDEVTEEVACAGRCGALSVCGTDFDCGGCQGEFSCNSDNVCACDDAPCVIASTVIHDTEDETVVDIAVDSTGAAYVLGNFDAGTITIGDDMHTATGNWTSVYLAKFLANDSVDWSYGWGDENTQTGTAVKVDGANNVLIGIDQSGSFDINGTAITERFVVAKLDTAGGTEWIVQDSAIYNTSTRGAPPVAMSIDRATNDVYVGGTFFNTFNVSPLSTTISSVGNGGYTDAYALRLNAAGEPLALRRYGDAYDEFVWAFAPGPSSVFVAMGFFGTMNFGTPNAVDLTSTEYYGLAIAKLGTGLTHGWSKVYDSATSSVEMDSDIAGNIYVSGTFSGDLPISEPALSTAETETFFAALDGDGETVWAKQFPNMYIFDVVVGPDGNVYVAGSTHGETDIGGGTLEDTGSTNMLFASFDPENGDLLWQRHYPVVVGNQRAMAIGISPVDGSIWLGVNYQGSMNFGDGAHVNQGGWDAAVIHYASP